MFDKLDHEKLSCGERCCEHIYDSSQPIRVALPDHRGVYYVYGVARRRNHGPVLTLAAAEWSRDGVTGRRPVRDVVTMMRLADAVSHHHTQSVNADKLYGPRGRISGVGRTEALDYVTRDVSE